VLLQARAAEDPWHGGAVQIQCPGDYLAVPCSPVGAPSGLVVAARVRGRSRPGRFSGLSVKEASVKGDSEREGRLPESLSTNVRHNPGLDRTYPLPVYRLPGQSLCRFGKALWNQSLGWPPP